MNRCGCKLKKYIDQIWSHKNIGFFALALTARVVRGSNSSFLLCRSCILNPSSLLVLYETVSSLLCDCQIQGKSKDGKFDNRNYFRHKIDVKVKA